MLKRECPRITVKRRLESSSKVNLLDLNRDHLDAFFTALGEKPFRASQVLRWVHQRGVSDLDAMTDLAKGLRARLHTLAELRLPELAHEHASADGTTKWLLRLDDGNCIETVFIPEVDRGTLCLSSQVGCVLNCSFCATARQGFNRNLTVAEIIGQVRRAHEALGAYASGSRPVTNIVMMGMGEPLLNLDNVVAAMDLMTDDLAYGLSRRRVTLSTAGVVPAIDRLRELSDVSLAVSLHAANDALRDTLVPLNRKYPIAELMAASRRYVAHRPRQRVTFEYVMLDGVNDTPAHARQLITILQGVPAKVNLIPFNPFPGSTQRCSSAQAIESFRNRLLAAGVMAVTRRTRGNDIHAACGQLAGRVRDRTMRSQRWQAALSGGAV